MNRHLGNKKGHFDANDANSILIWKELKEKNGDVKILCHKKQGELDPNFFGLGKDDFILCFMTNHQKMMVSKLMSKKHSVVMMDATHGTNQYDFKMVSVMTKNLNHQGEPLAHMFSNTENATALQFFLQSLRNECGKIKCKTFMSDSAPQYYNSWNSVMVDKGDDPPKKLLCAWHVIEAFRNNLSKVKQ